METLLLASVVLIVVATLIPKRRRETPEQILNRICGPAWECPNCHMKTGEDRSQCWSCGEARSRVGNQP